MTAAPAEPAARPPRPRWRDVLRLQWMLRDQAPAVMADLARRFGPFVRTRLPLQLYFVSGPAYIEEVLVKQASSFRKDRISRQLSRAIGDGLVLSEGDLWRRQRRLMQPAFHHAQLRSYADTMVALAIDAVSGWRPGETRNVHQDMMALTMNIVAKLLFGADLSADARDIGGTITRLMEDFSGNLGLSGLMGLGRLPTPRALRIRGDIKRLDEIVYRIIAQRRAAAEPGADLLALLLAAQDEDGSRMSDRQLRDETLTLFVAGHETTAHALTYALYLLAGHPDEQEALAAEVAEVLGGRRPGFGDLERLKRAEAVLQESMRLYPPVWGVGREALADVQIGPYRIPKGASVFISQWAVHRDPALFADPERFVPARWLGAPAPLPRFAYFPFGGGPRICIGNRFAMMEATLILAVLCQRFALARTPETRLRLLPTVTLRPRGPVTLAVASRSPPAA
ncbi:MAG TPA: cytochrome P450 [Polyangia bacterium]|nr:cytochrome P450 [Polyangia bacterium]